MATVELTKDNFEDIIHKNGTVIVDFWASWCGPCRAFAPTFEKASDEHDDIVFAKVDTEAQKELAGGFNIMAIPTLMVFRDQIMVYNESGALPPPALARLIEQVKTLDMDEVRSKLEEQQAAEETAAD